MLFQPKEKGMVCGEERTGRWASVKSGNFTLLWFLRTWSKDVRGLSHLSRPEKPLPSFLPLPLNHGNSGQCWPWRLRVAEIFPGGAGYWEESRACFRRPQQPLMLESHRCSHYTSSSCWLDAHRGRGREADPATAIIIKFGQWATASILTSDLHSTYVAKALRMY